MIYTKDLLDFCQNQREKAAEIITRTRKAKGITIYRLAKLSGIGEHTIERIENGLNVNTDSLYKVMFCLNVKNVIMEDLK